MGCLLTKCFKEVNNYSGFLLDKRDPRILDEIWKDPAQLGDVENNKGPLATFPETPEHQ